MCMANARCGDHGEENTCEAVVAIRNGGASSKGGT